MRPPSPRRTAAEPDADGGSPEPDQAPAELGRSVALNILGQAGSLLIGFVASVALARWLGPSERGLLAIMVEVASIAVAVAGIGLTYSVLYFAARRDSDKGAILGNSLLYGAGLAVVFVPGFWLLRHPLADLLSRGAGGLTWALAGALVSLLFVDWCVHNQVFALFRFGFMNLLRVASRVVFLICVIALVGGLGLGVTGGLIATIATSVVMIVGSLWIVLPLARPRLDRGVFRAMAGYGMRVQIGWLFEIANYRLDVIVLQFFRPLASVGRYFVAQVVAELVITLAYAFQTSVNPLVTHYEGDERQEQTSVAAIRHHSLLAAIGVVANAGLGTLVILYGFGPKFHGALVPMLILLPGMWFLGTGAVVAGDLRGRGRPGLTSLLAGLALVVTVALDVTLIPPLGVNGAALASVCAYTVFGLSSLIALSRVCGVPVKQLVVPTRADLALYPQRARQLVGRVWPGAFADPPA